MRGFNQRRQKTRGKRVYPNQKFFINPSIRIGFERRGRGRCDYGARRCNGG
jgi:hypothetical protein